ncbi:MAG TPA: OsmC family protein [Bryobacteraceae bacterium]|nr:OsmC family protein [Bryobacteraceae bacterium]
MLASLVETIPIMEVKVRYLGGKKFEMTARGHQIVADQPLDDDGTDAAMTPTELFLSGLGACAAYYAEEYLRARALPFEPIEVRISAVKGDSPARIVKVQMEVLAPELNKRHRDGILRAVDACLLENTLHKPPQIEVRIASAGQAAERELAAV